MASHISVGLLEWPLAVCGFYGGFVHCKHGLIPKDWNRPPTACGILQPDFGKKSTPDTGASELQYHRGLKVSTSEAPGLSPGAAYYLKALSAHLPRVTEIPCQSGSNAKEISFHESPSP
jgi:hypothetical protein